MVCKRDFSKLSSKDDPSFNRMRVGETKALNAKGKMFTIISTFYCETLEISAKIDFLSKTHSSQLGLNIILMQRFFCN